MDEDALYVIQNNLWNGAWQAGVNEAMKCSSSDDLRQVLMYRCYLGMGNYDLILDEIEDDASASLMAIKYFAKFLMEGGDSGPRYLEAIQSLTPTDTTQIFLASIHANQGNTDEALKILFNLPTNLDALSMMVSILLSINCVAKAEEVLQRMIKLDEDSTLVELCQAWIGICKGTEASLKEASEIAQGLCSAISTTPLLLNMIAICHMKSDRYDEAHSSLLEALEKDPKDGETLANLISCEEAIGENPEKVATLRTRRLNLLSSSHPNNTWLNALKKFEEDFERYSHV